MILDQRVRLRVLSWLGGEGGVGSHGAPTQHAERMLPWAVVGGVILAAGLMTLWTDNEDGFTYARGWPSVFERWDIGRLNIYIGPRQYEPFHGSFSGRALAVDLVCLAASATAAGTATRMLIERRYSLRMLLVLTVTISVTMGMVRLAPHVEAQSRQLRSTADGG